MFQILFQTDDSDHLKSKYKQVISVECPDSFNDLDICYCIIKIFMFLHDKCYRYLAL